MKQPKIALARAKYKRLTKLLRRKYLQLLGLNIKSGGTLGKIVCNWPKNVSIGSGCTIEDQVNFGIQLPFSDENYIRIGDRVFIGRYCSFICTSKIIIGNDTMIGGYTIVVDVNHEINRETTINSQPVISKDVIIGNDVGIGTGCIILPGVTIGNGSLIAAGSIVNKSIGEYEMWAGSPVRFLGKRK